MLNEPPFSTLHHLALRLGLPPVFLREEALAGRLPCIQSGGQLVFHVATVQRVLAQRAGHVPPTDTAQHAGPPACQEVPA